MLPSLFAVSLLVVTCDLAAGLAAGLSSASRSSLRRYSQDRYAEWSVDVEAFEETLAEPLVYVDVRPGAGRGVFAREFIAAGTTVTEYVGCLAPTPQTHCEEMELQQNFYGDAWRKYSQRYEIGLSASRVFNSAGVSKGGAFMNTLEEDEDEDFGAMAETCDVDEGLEACLTRAGLGDYVLLGKPPEQGASPNEGVAQLINDHTALRAPLKMDPTADSGDDDSGVISSADVDSFICSSSDVPVATNLEALYASVDEYIAEIAPRTNVALVQAQHGSVASSRVFAVATRPIGPGEELCLTYGVEWWLAQLRRAALAQLVSCNPDPTRKSALVGVIRDMERVSCERLPAQVDAVGRSGCMPRAYVAPLEKLPSLDRLLNDDDEDSWRKLILGEEFQGVTECTVEHLYSDTFAEQNSPLF